MLRPALNITYVHDTQTLGQLRDYLADCNGVTGFDLETEVKELDTKDYYERKCRTIQFGDRDEQYVIDLLAFTTPVPHCKEKVDVLAECQGHYGKHLGMNPGLRPVFDLIGPVLASRDIIKVGISLGFEYTVMYWNFGIRCQGLFDCGLVEKVICAGFHSLKSYAYYGMEEMAQRYFGVQIDKELQTSFKLGGELTRPQLEYAALDTRLPISIKKWQDLILKGHTAVSAPYLSRFSPRLLGDDLTRVAQIENDCIGAFQDMTIHGERIDRERWLASVGLKKIALNSLIFDRLDPIFIPLVGSKLEQTSQEEVDWAHKAWKAFTVVPREELDLLRDLRMAKKRERHAAKHPDQLILYNDETPLATSTEIQLELDWMEATRLCEKDRLKGIWNTMSKLNTKIKELKEDCEGVALINYGSDTQLLRCINGDHDCFRELRKACGKVMVMSESGTKVWTGAYKCLENLDDDTFEELGQFPVIKLIQELHDLNKDIGTYGDAWGTEWTTHPCKQEGWLNPGDGKLHSTFNQLEAETGRSSSERPNGQNIKRDKDVRSCFIVDPPDEEEPDGYVMITADMSGAELRILAELANDPIWIGAFNRKEDVHCICAELMDEEGWEYLTAPACAYYQLREDGTPLHRKCKCPGHDEKRNAMKPTNFGLPYGISPHALAKQIGKTVEETEMLMAKHRDTFPRIWLYLAAAGIMTRMQMKSFDMFGRRRLYAEPTREMALKRAKVYREEQLRLSETEITVNIAKWRATYGKNPGPYDKWMLSHRMPKESHVDDSERAMYNAIERQGKNHRIQGTNASIAKVAMGAGSDPDGKPYLWHTLGQYKATLIKFVHDELVIQAPKRFGELVAALVGDAFKRAAAEVMTSVTMEFEYNIAGWWAK